MIDAVLAAAVCVLFFVAPVAGVVMVALDVHRSRVRGPELRDRRRLARAMREADKVLRGAKPERYQAVMLNALESSIEGMGTASGEAITRVLIDVAAVGLGEDSQDALRRDTARRRRILRLANELASTIEDESNVSVLEGIGQLLGLLLQHGELRQPEEPEIVRQEAAIIKTWMKACAKLLDTDPIAAHHALQDALVVLSDHGSAQLDGLTVLIPRWARIELLSAYRSSHQSSRSLTSVLDDMARAFEGVAGAYARGDLTEVASIIFR